MIVPAIGVPELTVIAFNLLLFVGFLGGLWYAGSRIRRAL